MGSFSWNRADNLGKYENISVGQPFKLLIPKEFGGGFIQDSYRGYGEIYDSKTNKLYDIYELFAFWNKHSVVPISDCTYHPMTIEVGDTVTIQIKSSDIHMFKEEALKFDGQSFKVIAKHGKPKMAVQDDYSPFNSVPYQTDVYELSGEAGEVGYWPWYGFKNTGFWEKLPPEGLQYYKGEWEPLPEKTIYTDHNRTMGINLFYKGGGNTGNVKYPLKLVSVEFKGTYEDCTGYSKNDPDQGCIKRKRKRNE